MTSKTKIICITGGKGGTGKTLVAVNLATMFVNKSYKVLLIDGDVENPNTYLLMGGKLENKKVVPFFKPTIIEGKCNTCGICAQNCAPHALLHLNNTIPIPMLNLCSGCKLCFKICPTGAIKADSKEIGGIYSLKVNNINLLLGELKPSEARSAAIVEAILDESNAMLQHNNIDIVILDTAPGAHCDVELLINTADYIIPVTEPTRFGILDLNRILELIKLLGKDYRVVVNRSSLLGARDEFMEKLNDENIEILGDIPLDEDIVQSYCQGEPLMGSYNADKKSKAYVAFEKIFSKLLDWIGN